MKNFEARPMQLFSKDDKKSDVADTINESEPRIIEKQKVANEPAIEKEMDLKEEEDRYSPEAIRENIKFKTEKIRDWAQQTGLSEGKEFKIIESIRDIDTDMRSIAPHELRQFFVVMHENYYREFNKYILFL